MAAFRLGAPVKHLLVDLDGTLLGNRSIPLSVEFVAKSLKALNKHVRLADGARTLLAVQSVFRKPSTESTNDVRIVEIFSKKLGLPLDEARQFVRESLATIFPTLSRHFYPMPGAKSFLDWAKDHYTLMLATNPIWSPDIIEMRVRWAGIDPKIFGDITHVRKMHAFKPSPEYYQEILAQQGYQAADCLLIGNDYKMDLPATQVGVRVFIVGKSKPATSVKYPGASASAWKGSFEELREMLERQ